MRGGGNRGRLKVEASHVQPRVLRIAGFAVMGVYTLFALAMLYGDALSDPGGLKGAIVFLPTLAFVSSRSSTGSTRGWGSPFSSRWARSGRASMPASASG